MKPFNETRHGIRAAAIVPGRWHYRALAALLALTFVTGGGSYDRGPGDVLVQLAALPLLAWSLMAARRLKDRGVWWALATAGLVLAVVALQCLPLPVDAWRGNPARAALLADLGRAGVEGVPRHWSLAPLATERGLWSLLPALALFAGALSLDADRRRRIVLLVIALVLASVVLGAVQLGLPQDSWLNFFPEWSPAFTGVFASPNHQATAITVALMLLLALLLERRQLQTGDAITPVWHRVAMGAAVLLLLASLPLTGSRAMGVLAILGLLAVALLSGVVLRALHSSRMPRLLAWLGAAMALGVAVAVTAVGLQWIRVDIQEDVRAALAMSTYRMGGQLAPWGAGVGSFVPWFDQFAPDRLFGWEYFNHAHNEYVQWWLESGAPGLLAMAAVLGWLVWSRPPARHSAQGLAADGVTVGSWVAVGVVLAHSIVDYPLRTPAMMGVTALLAGIAVAAALSRAPDGMPGTILQGRPNSG